MTSNPLMSRLGLRHPIVQGPFGGGLSTVPLAAEVSNRGGLGSFGAQMLEPAEIGPLVARLRAATRHSFALNLWVSDEDPGGMSPDAESFERHWQAFAPHFAARGVGKPPRPARAAPRFEAQVEALLEAAPPAFSFVFGIPGPHLLDACRSRGIFTIGTATTLDEAMALEDARVDAIVATGMEAGGHRPSFLASAEASLTGTFALVQLIARRVRVPVIAAGGIVDAAGIRAALALGAQAAQLGTAFLACAESGANAAHREALFDARARHTTLTRAFSGRLARGIENRWTREMRDAPHAPYPLQSWFLARLHEGRATDPDLSALWCGQAAPNLQHRRASVLMDALIDGLAPASASATTTPMETS